MDFDYSLNYSELDLRAHPELYRVGRGEQGVLSVEPYKSEILPHWRFKTPDVARESAAKIYELYTQYREAQDFVGMDMAQVHSDGVDAQFTLLQPQERKEVRRRGAAESQGTERRMGTRDRTVRERLRKAGVIEGVQKISGHDQGRPTVC